MSTHRNVLELRPTSLPSLGPNRGWPTLNLLAERAKVKPGVIEDRHSETTVLV
jgi:hypothetical protein